MIDIQLLDAGYCLHPQHVVLRNRSFRPMRFNSMFAVMIHPKEGVILFDTGYSIKFLEVTRRFPAKIYALTTPVRLKEADCAVFKLRKMGIEPKDVRHILISHFHADHFGAISDFPKATYWFDAHAWESIRNMSRWRSVFSGFLPELIPDDFLQRSKPLYAAQRITLPSHYHPFTSGMDIFGDQSILLVDLPGHAQGQLGCIVQSTGGKSLFLVADACWTSKSFEEQIVPHPITRILFSDYEQYQRTLRDIQTFAQSKPNFLIIPSHCPKIHKHHCNRGSL
jgi:glyoxylase-like metal-dependent hydrolase (beta-lactamase superfamily II)